VPTALADPPAAPPEQQPPAGPDGGARPSADGRAPAARTCANCGAPLADAGPGHRHDAAVDPRWAALQQLSEQGNDKHQDRRAGAIDLQEG